MVGFFFCNWKIGIQIKEAILIKIILELPESLEKLYRSVFSRKEVGFFRISERKVSIEKIRKGSMRTVKK